MTDGRRLSGGWLTVALLAASGAIYFLSDTIRAQAPACIALTDHALREDGGAIKIAGNVRNNCDRGFETVTVVFKLEQPPAASGKLPAAVAYDYLGEMKPGTTKAFESSFPVPPNTNYRLEEVIAY